MLKQNNRSVVFIVFLEILLWTSFSNSGIQLKFEMNCSATAMLFLKAIVGPHVQLWKPK